MTSVLTRRRKFEHRHTGPPERRPHVKVEAEIGAIHLQAKDHQGLPTTNRNQEETGRILPFSLQREHGLADTLISDFWPPEL